MERGESVCVCVYQIPGNPLDSRIKFQHSGMKIQKLLKLQFFISCSENKNTVIGNAANE